MRLGTESLHTIEIIDGFEQGPTDPGFFIHILRPALTYPGNEGTEVAQSESVPRAGEEPAEGDGIVRSTEDAEPGVKVDDFGHFEETAEGSDLHRDAAVDECIAHRTHLAVLAKEDGDLAPRGSRLMERLDLLCDPAGLRFGGVEPVGDDVSGSRTIAVLKSRQFTGAMQARCGSCWPR